MAMTVTDKTKAKDLLTGDDYRDQGNQYLSKAANLVSGNAPYNPYTDPVYASAQASSQRNAEQASNQSMAAMNKRGILNSSITSDRDAQIRQDAASKVTDLIPQLAGNYQNQQQNQIGNYRNIANSYLTEGQNMNSRTDQQAQNDRSYNFDLATQKASNTGFYTSPDTPSYDDIQKQMADNSDQWQENPNNDPAITAKNEQLHNKNLALSSLIGEEYNPQTGSYSGGDGTVQGTPTFDLKKFLYGEQQDQITNKAAEDKFNYDKQQDYKKFNYDQNQDQITNQYNQNKFDYGKIQDAKQLGISSKNAETSRMNAQNSIERRALSNLYKLWETSGKAPDGIPGVTKGTLLPARADKISDKKTKQMTQSAISDVSIQKDRESAMRYLSDNQDGMLSSGVNISDVLDEINKLFPLSKVGGSPSNTPSIFPKINGGLGQK